MKAKDREALFDDEFLRKLEYLKIVSDRLLPGHLKGEHRAKRRGAGIEFADFRPYVAGDDTRNVDWRAFLRLDKLILRLFEEEADLPVYIFVDSSRSMTCGAPSKFDYARRVAAALCYIGLLNLDRVSIVAYSGGVVEEMRPARGKEQIWRAFRFLEGIPAGGATSLQRALKSFFAVERRRGLVAVVSDFLDRDEIGHAFKFLHYLRHDVIAVHIVSPEEARPELPDEVILVDSEDQTIERFEVTPALLGAYEDELQGHFRALESSCKKYGWGYLQTVTEVPFEDLILQVFRQERFLR